MTAQYSTQIHNIHVSSLSRNKEREGFAGCGPWLTSLVTLPASQAIALPSLPRNRLFIQFDLLAWIIRPTLGSKFKCIGTYHWHAFNTSRVCLIKRIKFTNSSNSSSFLIVYKLFIRKKINVVANFKLCSVFQLVLKTSHWAYTEIDVSASKSFIF